MGFGELGECLDLGHICEVWHHLSEDYLHYIHNSDFINTEAPLNGCVKL